MPMSHKHATTLIKSLCASGAVRHARALFDEMPDRDVVAWTAMLSGYASNSRHGEALDVFRRMVSAGVGPNEFTLSSVLTACRGVGSEAAGCCCGESIHAVAVRRGVDHMPYVVNALIDAYASRGEGLVDARRLFDELGSERTAASWTSMIAGYARWGQESTGLQLFQKMIQDGVELSPFTCSIAIHACASVANLYFGQQIHVLSIRKALRANLAVANSLVNMYCTCASIMDARRLFDEMSERNLVTWNTIIAGCSRRDPLMALQLLVDMDLEPNCLTLTGITSACAGLAALRCGQQVHGAVIRKYYGEDLKISNALVDMYSKCGTISYAKKVFNMISCKDILSWTSMISGYGTNGYVSEAIELFNSMVDAGVHPDHVVFMGLISACSHAGLVDEGCNLFRSMISEYNMQPNKEIYSCITNLLARARRLGEAFDLIDAMPFAPDESVWGALLGACKLHKNVELGRLAARKIVEINPDAVKTYILLANIYAADSKWSEYAVTRRLLRGTGSSKEVGMSWIEITNKMYSFSTADSSGPQVSLADEVLQVLVEHMDEAGNDFVDNISRVA
ncbi:putative pentatricopeptide repeat-containing protein At1g56570 [Phragmites australis]|uniref:putative pentatricopeptide repeat-containing protein At1g56570 n=1 Tax=Phragmites australis TaxID=29695 RepID=UPI002D77404D|nr:putative pentatricopeptide repeat-containing protein At1g56570 [Phragmites australis]XP_062209037.1 putative pentatricopeptide repeat-containing protein At1g56570 [Phragmites australis]